MPAGEEVKRAKKKAAEDEPQPAAPAARERKNTEQIDSLIDEIDEVLEENAEEFVRSYVQKGGQ
ncbi:MAG: ubiquitin-like protein Pup [Actinomycetota bacterium]